MSCSITNKAAVAEYFFLPVSVAYNPASVCTYQTLNVFIADLF